MTAVAKRGHVTSGANAHTRQPVSGSVGVGFSPNFREIQAGLSVVVNNEDLQTDRNIV